MLLAMVAQSKPARIAPLLPPKVQKTCKKRAKTDILRLFKALICLNFQAFFRVFEVRKSLESYSNSYTKNGLRCLKIKTNSEHEMLEALEQFERLGDA
jgi:hypothetical protein